MKINENKSFYGMSCNSPTTQQPDDGDGGEEAKAGQCQGEGEGVARSAS